MTDLSDDEASAAEYVLGTLDAVERTHAETRRTRDSAFEDLIEQWETRLAPLAHATPALAPPPELFDAILRRLPPVSKAGRRDNVVAMRRQIHVWRGVAAVASALAAVLALWVVARGVVPHAAVDQTYVAVLQQGADKPAFVVSLDLANHRMAVVPVATTAPAGKSYEVWMIGADQAPRSMGVIEAQATLRPSLPEVGSGVISTATYAVTLEPLGGSPSGKPTSAPLFVGKPVDTSL